jgi:hypothetical protein
MMRWIVMLGAVLLLAHYPSHAPAVLLLLGAAALVIWLCSGPAGSSVYHGHGLSRQDAAFHEAGHVVVARHRGASDIAAWVGEDGAGITRANERGTVDHAVILAAGQAAASRFLLPNPRGCQQDAAELEQICLELGISPRDVRRIADREVAAHAREIRNVAERLNRRGSLR